MKYSIITFGCQLNKSDSEKIAGLLEKQGHKLVKSEKQANLIIINVCSVRQSAIDRVYAKVEKYYKAKKIIITGCILKKDKNNLKNKVAEFWHPSNYFNCFPLYQNKWSAFVPISTGCNNFCAYCVVPYVRGREICRPAKEIVAEVKSLVKKGYKEIWLLGQNVNSFHFPIRANKSMVDFPKLLRMVNDIPGDFWIRFTSPHPKDFSNELIDVMAECEKVTEYLNLPLQSGDNQILKKMNRPYTTGDYKKIVKKIRKKIPNITLSTDIIVGFPGETKKQFENTAQLMKEIKLDMAYIARYSPRPGTTAFKMKDNIISMEKKQREKILTDILKKTALEKNKKYIGKNVEVLIDKIKNGFAFGKTRTFKTVKISLSAPRKARHIKPGDIVKTKILKPNSFGLCGKIA